MCQLHAVVRWHYYSLGMKDVALSLRMARPSMDYCWVQREEADEVNRHLLEFVFT